MLAGPLSAASRLVTGQADAVRVLFTLTRFETFDALAGADRDLAAVVPDVLRLAAAAVRLA